MAEPWAKHCIKEGMRVKIVRPVCRYPVISLDPSDYPDGATGTITEIQFDPAHQRDVPHAAITDVWVKLDHPHEELKDWDNELHWYEENIDDFWEDTMVVSQTEPKNARGWFLLIRDGNLLEQPSASGVNWKKEGAVYVIWRKTRRECLEQLQYYIRDKGAHYLKEVTASDFNMECGFSHYPDGSYILIDASDKFGKLPLPEIADNPEYTLTDEYVCPGCQDQSSMAAIIVGDGYWCTPECFRDAPPKGWVTPSVASLTVKLNSASDALTKASEALFEADSETSSLKARVAELELLLDPEIEMTDQPLQNSHFDLPSMETMMNNQINKQVQKAMNKAKKKQSKDTPCGVCNKMCKGPDGVQNHQRSTKCGQVLAKALVADQVVRASNGIKPESVLLAEVAYKRDVMKFQFMQTCVRWAASAAAVSFVVYHLV